MQNMTTLKMKRRKWIIGLVLLALLLMLYIITSLWISTNLLTVRRFEADFGTGSEVRAVVISDLHDHSFGGGNHELAEKIRELEPDLILMDGDMLNAESTDARVPLKLIGQLKDTRRRPCAAEADRTAAGYRAGLLCAGES